MAFLASAVTELALAMLPVCSANATSTDARLQSTEKSRCGKSSTATSGGSGSGSSGTSGAPARRFTVSAARKVRLLELGAKVRLAVDEERMTRAGTPNTQLDWDPIVAKVNTALAAANQPIKTKEQLKMRWKYIMQHGQAAE